MSNVLSSVRDVESHFRDLESLAVRDVETRSRFFKTSNHLIWTRNSLFEMLKLVQEFSRCRISFSRSGIVSLSRCRNLFEIFQDIESPLRGIRNNLFEMLKLVQEF
jgi:hypothetical protein